MSYSTMVAISLLVPLCCLSACIYLAMYNKTRRPFATALLLGIFLTGVWLPEVLGLWITWRSALRISEYAFLTGATLVVASWVSYPCLRAGRFDYLILILMTAGFAAFWWYLFLMRNSP